MREFSLAIKQKYENIVKISQNILSTVVMFIIIDLEQVSYSWDEIMLLDITKEKKTVLA